MPPFRPGVWERREQPVLSAMTSDQGWSQVKLYSPAVVRTDDSYLMWYVGNRSRARADDHVMGLAKSNDGIRWEPHPENPILGESDLPWGYNWQTPHVIFDEEAGAFRMWFTGVQLEEGGAGTETESFQKLGYATSDDGVHWDVHPEPIHPRGRGPCVRKRDGEYHMWLGTSSDVTTGVDYQAIYHFTSTDGIGWTRDDDPAVTPTEGLESVVYPFVFRHDDGYVMFYGCHHDSETPRFELFCSTSRDGTNWTHHQDEAVFPATRDANDFDGRYTSTPWVVDEGDRYLLYYSARDCANLYAAGDGTIQTDEWGLYQHIGVATYPER